jgi:hypothetical protein
LILCHTTSTYPCKPDELNLRMIPALHQEFNVPVGYSGHEVGLQTSVAAVVLGACLIERHITLDRAMWGSDQAASVEPMGFMRLVRDIRVVERAMGDGIKRVYESEKPIRDRLRRVSNTQFLVCSFLRPYTTTCARAGKRARRDWTHSCKPSAAATARSITCMQVNAASSSPQVLRSSDRI